MIEIKSPGEYKNIEHKISIFLAGSIETGTADDWQKLLVNELKDYNNLLLLNPRRDEWDNSWKQSIDNSNFNQQVNWELNALDFADYIIMYFCPNTKSPITLLELGLHAANNPEKLIVCCPEGFWRKGNVDIVCKRYGIEQVFDLSSLIDYIKLVLCK